MTAAFHFVDSLLLIGRESATILFILPAEAVLHRQCDDQKVATTSITNKTMLENTYDRLSNITKK